MRQNAYNVVFFLLLAGGILSLWFYADQNWFPKNEVPKKDAEAEKKKDDDKAKPPDKAPPPAPKDEPKAAPKAPSKPSRLIALGKDGFYIRVLLTSRGGGVQQVMLDKFNEADRLGREVKEGNDPAKLFLVPGIVQFPLKKFLSEQPALPDIRPGEMVYTHDANAPPSQRLVEPSYTLFHYATAEDNYPDPHLGEVNWDVVPEPQPEDGSARVVFETKLLDPYFIKIRKVFTLAPKEYHVGLRIEFERLPGGQKGKGLFRYQISGPRGLPVEGEWYTSTTRVALIGWTNKKGAFKRQYEDAATIGSMRGGEKALSAGGENAFKYAAITTQYFTSALVIIDDGKPRWSYVRATSELEMIPSPDEIKKLEDDAKADPKNPFLAGRLLRIRDLRERKLPELDDITFRAVAEPIDLAENEKLVHDYAIYNGPTKVRLLKLEQGDRKVDEALVDRYHDEFGLRTLTDFRSPTALGRFADAIYWTDIVILFTNLMHAMLWGIHYVVGSWGLSIILLTVMVRLVLFIPSRKQTQMNMRMMEVQKKLKPELDKLHEKYKDDFNTYNREKTRLMMQHGMNPFAAMGGCLLLFAQMPIMMGLYFCLQESIFFRLDNFLWIDNLAAPDMSVWWSENVPMISDPDNRHGTFSFLYLGPYLNILPLIAVGLMLYQQNKMMPPPTDEQMATQQRMMKIMMIVVAFMFYKVAAGLALYFSISTLWGLIERQLIPKAPEKPADDAASAAVLLPNGGSPNGQVEPDKPKGILGRFRQRLQERIEEMQKKAAEQSSRQVKNPKRNDPIRRDKKKRRK